MTVLVFALMVALQTAAIGPRTGNDAIPSSFQPCDITIQGQLIFPPYTQRIRAVTIDLEPMVPFEPKQETTSLPYDQFTFTVKHSGMYEIEIDQPGLDAVRQLLVLAPSDCGVVFVDVPLRISPAIKPSPIAEDVVSIETLMRKTQAKIVSAFENKIDNAASNPEKTATDLAGLVASAPDYYEANLELGLEYQKLGRREDAIRSLTRALELNSASMRARAALAQYSYEAGDYQKKADLVAEAVRLGAATSSVYYMMGSSLYNLGDLERAEASLLRSLSLVPIVPKAHMQLFNVYARRGKFEAALKEADTYLNEYPDAPDREYARSMADKLRKVIKP